MKNKTGQSIDGQLSVNLTALRNVLASSNNITAITAANAGLTQATVVELCNGRYNSIRDSGVSYVSSYAYTAIEKANEIELHILVGSSILSIKGSKSTWSWTKI